MTAPHWNQAALRTQRAADALFAASDLRWVRAWAGFGDPALAFDSLIRAALATSPSMEAAMADAAWPQAGAWPTPTPPALARRPPASRLPARASEALVLRGGARDAGTMAATSGLRTSVPPFVRSVAQTAVQQEVQPAERPAPSVAGPGSQAPAPALAPPTHASAPPLRGRAARIAGLSSQAGARPALDSSASALIQATAAAAWPSRAEPSSSAALSLAAASSARSQPAALPLRLIESAVRHNGPRPLTTGLPSAASPSGASPVASPPPRVTRLVEGLPALQGLMQAAVADSRERHAVAAGDTRHAQALSPSAPAALQALPPAAPALRALPQLDAVAEDMLVDRLADRLQERLRDQALRHFGFTSGLN